MSDPDPVKKADPEGHKPGNGSPPLLFRFIPLGGMNVELLDALVQHIGLLQVTHELTHGRSLGLYTSTLGGSGLPS